MKLKSENGKREKGIRKEGRKSNNCQKRKEVV